MTITLLQLPSPLLPLPNLALSCPPAARVGTTAAPLRQSAPASWIWSGRKCPICYLLQYVQRESQDMSMVAVDLSRFQLEIPVGCYCCTSIGNCLKWGTSWYFHVLSRFSHHGIWKLISKSDLCKVELYESDPLHFAQRRSWSGRALDKRLIKSRFQYLIGFY